MNLKRVKEVGYVIIILLFCLWHSYPLWLGKPIAKFRYPDHHIHLYSALKLKEFIERNLSVSGWDDNFF